MMLSDPVKLELTLQVNELRRLLMEGIERGEVQPLPSTTFVHNELQEAIRYMSKGGLISKAVTPKLQEIAGTGY